MIEVANLVKRYGGGRAAVRDLSFSVEKGQLVGFLGPNGAGKSTTMRILAGSLSMTSGTVKVGGCDVATDPYGAKAQIGFMPEAVPLYPEMRVVEYLRFRAELKGVARSLRTARVGGAMEKAIVTDYATVPIGKLSKGYKQRVGLADALLAQPPLLILDEPTAGLDPNQIREVRAVLRALGEDHTVLLSTHILSEVEASCSRAIVINRGKLVTDDTIDGLRAKGAATALALTLSGDAQAIQKTLAGVGGVKKVEAGASRGDESDWVVTLAQSKTDKANKTGTTAGEVSEACVRALVSERIGVRAIKPKASSLEEVFAELTRSEALAAEEESAS
ncbi:MAG: ABC transporter ATP-binding protein [Polyangiaceae bacterium]